MSNPVVEEFAKALVQFVRDEAVQSCDSIPRPGVDHVIARRWRNAGEGVESIADILIPDIVDETIMKLLWAIDEGLLPLSFRGADGRTADLTRDGRSELAGWYFGSGGWREQYSSQRFVDNYPDLAESQPGA